MRFFEEVLIYHHVRSQATSCTPTAHTLRMQITATTANAINAVLHVAGLPSLAKIHNHDSSHVPILLMTLNVLVMRRPIRP